MLFTCLKKKYHILCPIAVIMLLFAKKNVNFQKPSIFTKKNVNFQKPSIGTEYWGKKSHKILYCSKYNFKISLILGTSEF